MDEWLYFMLYPGTLSRLDNLLRGAVAPLIRQVEGLPGLKCWFFIRYIDDGGAHVRLRFQVSAGAISFLYHLATERFQRVLPQVAAASAECPQRLVPLPISDEPHRGARFRLSLYEPEYGKYGGPVGVHIAEELFEASSRLALQVIDQKSEGLSQQANLAIYLMRQSVNAALPEAEQPAFWDRYSRYWSGDDQLWSSLRTAARRRASIIRSTYQGLETAADQPGVEAYSLALRRAVAKVRAASLPVSIEQLCFHWVHMMNNRLGFYPMDEAYLAQLAPMVG